MVHFWVDFLSYLSHRVFELRDEIGGIQIICIMEFETEGVNNVVNPSTPSAYTTPQLKNLKPFIIYCE
jgi:hypothetical protein